VAEHPADSALAQLELTLENHQQWAESLVAGILANTPPSDDNLVPGAHMLCDFGKWYYSQTHSSVLTEQPLFTTLEKKHRALHDTARRLLMAPAGTEKAEAYRLFSGASSDMALHIRNLVQALLTNELTTDALTGVPNRRQMDEQLEDAIYAANNVLGAPACLSLADLDHFKRINDTYGHAVGDEVLKAFSQLLITSMRDTDRIYRYGGEEFLIFMNHVDLERAESILDRLRRKNLALPPAHRRTAGTLEHHRFLRHRPGHPGRSPARSDPARGRSPVPGQERRTQPRLHGEQQARRLGAHIFTQPGPVARVKWRA